MKPRRTAPELIRAARAAGDRTVPTKKPKVRDEGKAGESARLLRGLVQSAGWHLNRGVGATPREACGCSAGTRSGAGSHRMRVRRRGVRSDDADRPLHEARAARPSARSLAARPRQPGEGTSPLPEAVRRANRRSA